MNVAHQFVDVFERNGSKTAIVDAHNRSTTYAELFERVVLAREAIRLAALPDAARVILQLPAGADFAVASVALVAEGKVPVGIEVVHGSEVYRDRAEFLNADAVVRSTLVERLQFLTTRSRRAASVLTSQGIALPPALPLRDLDVFGSVMPAEHQVHEADAEATAFIIFTGGTTARPKGVRLSHRAVGAYIDGLTHLPEWDGVESLVADLPQQVLYGLAHGKTVHLSKGRASAHGQHVARLLFESGIDAYFGSPTRWADILDQRCHIDAAHAPHVVILGGAPVTPHMLARLDEELSPTTSIRCTYGMTELGLIAHVDGREKRARQVDDGDFVGELIPGVTASITAAGELALTTPARFSGYIGDPTALRSEPFATGDLALLDRRGLTLRGRTKDMVVADGVNLYAGQFESRLLQTDPAASANFDEVALVATPIDALGDERFVLFYIGPDISEAEALSRAAALFPDGLGPIQAVRLDVMPVKGRQGKLDKTRLGTLARERLSAPSLRETQERLLGQLGHAGVSRPKLEVISLVSRRSLDRANGLDTSGLPDIKAPIFILGHQRSGTTAMHHGLSTSSMVDGPSLLDMVVPRPAMWRASSWLGGAVDKRLAAGATERLDAIGDRHPLRLSLPEEEEFLFAGLALSGYLPSAFDATLGRRDFDWIRQRDTWPDRTIDELLDVHTTLLRSWRHHREVPEHVRHLGKNPALGPLADRLVDRFGDARFVVMMRDAEASIPSRISLISAVHGRLLRPAEVDVIVEDSIHQMEATARAVRKLPDDQVMLVDSTKFALASAGCIREVARWLGLETNVLDNGPVTVQASTSVDLGYSAAELRRRLPEFNTLLEEARR